MPQPPRRVELEAASILLGIDDEHPAGADHQVVEVGPAAGDGQVVQDRPPLPLQPSQAGGRCAAPPLPRVARPWPPGWAETAAPSRPPRPRAAPTTRPNRGATRRPRTAPPTPMPRVAATRQGMVRVQAAHSAARNPPPPGLGRPARPAHAGSHPHRHHRSIRAGASQQLVGIIARWARMACRSAWLSGRTDPLGRSSSSKGHGRGLAIEGSFLVVSAGGPLGTWPATLLMRSRLGGGLTGRLALVGAVGGPLLGREPDRWPSGPAAGRPAEPGRAARGRAPGPDR